MMTDNLTTCMLVSLYVINSYRLEGDGEFTDAEGLEWTGVFRSRAALGLKLKLNM